MNSMTKMSKDYFQYFILLFSSLLLFCNTSKQQKVAFDGKVNSVKGHVTIRKQTSSKWLKLNTSSRIEYGDNIATDSGSLVEIGFGDSNTITVGESSQAVVTAVTDSNGNSTIEIYNAFGTVLSNIHPKAGENSRYRVCTPSAIAEIEGTYFWVSFRRKSRTTHVNVLSGNVRVRNPRLKKRGFVDINPGHFTFITWDEHPTLPKRLNYGQWKRMGRVMPPGQYKKYTHKFKIKKPHKLRQRHRRNKLRGNKTQHSLRPFKRKPFKKAIKQRRKKVKKKRPGESKGTRKIK